MLIAIVKETRRNSGLIYCYLIKDFDSLFANKNFIIELFADFLRIILHSFKDFRYLKLYYFLMKYYFYLNNFLCHNFFFSVVHYYLHDLVLFFRFFFLIIRYDLSNCCCQYIQFFIINLKSCFFY